MTTSDADIDTSVVVTQRIAAPPDAVFDFLVDSGKLLRWIGTEARLDPQPGGEFWVNVNGGDRASGSYVEVDRPNRVVFTWGWEGSDVVPPGASTVTVSLVADDGGTTVELRHEGLPPGQPETHAHGWTHYLGRLGIAGVGDDPGADTFITDTDTDTDTGADPDLETP